MAKSNSNIQMPSSGAGLTRYFGDYKSKLELAPGHVIVLAVLIAALAILLKLYGKGWFGLP